MYKAECKRRAKVKGRGEKGKPTQKQNFQIASTFLGKTRTIFLVIIRIRSYHVETALF